MEAKHTPGPWFVANGNKIHDRETKFGENGEQIGNTANEIAMTFYDPTERGTKEANARLIAAAPELLEACKRAQNFICVGLKDGGISPICSCNDSVRKVMRGLNTAIAKAKGQ